MTVKYIYKNQSSRRLLGFFFNYAHQRSFIETKNIYDFAPSSFVMQPCPFNKLCVLLCNLSFMSINSNIFEMK